MSLFYEATLLFYVFSRERLKAVLGSMKYLNAMMEKRASEKLLSKPNRNNRVVKIFPRYQGPLVSSYRSLRVAPQRQCSSRCSKVYCFVLPAKQNLTNLLRGGDGLIDRESPDVSATVIPPVQI